jgi:hypothetical protein
MTKVSVQRDVELSATAIVARHHCDISESDDTLLPTIELQRE